MQVTKRRWLALSVLGFLTLLGSPTLAFRGRVVDGQGRPQASAEVFVLGRPGEAFTDAEGYFEWRPDPAAPFEVLVLLRDGTYTRPVLVESLEPEALVTVTIQAAVRDSMVVSGTAPGIESTPAAGTTTLSAAEIEARQPSNLIQALENVAGVSQVSEGQAAVPALRGLAGGRTLILIDGARVTAERRVGPSATFLDPAVFESVDVSRGPGSVAYGSDAFGGVISVRTRSVEPGTPFRVRGTAMVGEGRPEERYSAGLSKGLEEGGFLLTAHSRQAADWESPRGTVFNSGYEDRGVLLRGEHRIGGGDLTASWQSDFGRDIERPRNNSSTVRFYYPVEDSHRFTATYDAHGVGGFSRVLLSGFVGSYDQTTDQDRFATETTGRSIERAEIEARDFQLRGTVERLLGKSRLEAGVDLNGRYDLKAFESRLAYDLAGAEVRNERSIAIEDADRLDTGVFASLDIGLARRLSLAGGVRGDHVTTDNSGGYFGNRSTSHDAASGYLALTASSPSGLSATLQVARGFRDPTLSDRYYRGPTGRGFITGNPELDPETSLQYDLALRYGAGRFRVAAFYYRYDIGDLVERYETEPDFFLFRNRGEARVEGFELEAQGDLGLGLTLELAAQTSDGIARGDDSDLDGIPPFNVSAQLRRQFGERAFAQLRVASFDRDDEPGPTERLVPGYTLIDLSAGYDFAGPTDLRVIARNLLDEEYFASESSRAVLAPGRSAALVVSVEF